MFYDANEALLAEIVLVEPLEGRNLRSAYCCVTGVTDGCFSFGGQGCTHFVYGRSRIIICSGRVNNIRQQLLNS